MTFGYGLLYPELSAASGITLGSRQKEDTLGDQDRIRSARFRACWLAGAAALLGVVFVPAAFDHAWNFLDRVPKALDAFDGGRVIVLLGGRNKHNDFSALARRCERACRLAVLFGEARSELEQAFRDSGAEFAGATTMGEALRLAHDAAVPGDVVLLSPACASFDEFAGFEDRGRTFAKLVRGTGQR